MSKYLISILLLVAFVNNVEAQFGITHEIGVLSGPMTLKSDYGESGDFKATVGNMGYGIGVVHYLNFSDIHNSSRTNWQTYFKDHFKVRSEISYHKIELQHYGKYVDPKKQSVFAKQLRAMRGSSAITNLGIQLEYYPISIEDFGNNFSAFSPYISFGGQYSFYTPTATSTLGKINTPRTTPEKYSNGALSNREGTVWSLVTSVGTRYKLNAFSDLLVDMRAQYYFSDSVDGLNPDPAIYTENKSNDWNIWFSVGYVYYLNY